MKWIPNPINTKQCIDTGMALVLIHLIAQYYLLKSKVLLGSAIMLLIISIVIPKTLKPLAYFWFSFSHILGSITSKIILTIVYFIFVTPLGLLRSFLSKDSLRLKSFKKSSQTVFVTRNHCFTADDFFFFRNYFASTCHFS